MRQREYRMCILICTREAREMSKMEWQDRSTHREQWENEERAWYEMYSSWISDSLCERCSETQSAHPSTPLPCTSHPLSGLSACKPTKSLYYHKLTQHDKLRWWKCRCGLLLNPLKQHYTDVRPSFPPPNWCVIHHHHTPTCGHFYCFESAVEGDGESCLKSTSDFINIPQCDMHTAPAPANGLCYAHPQIPGVSWVVRFSLTSVYSQLFAGF